MKKQIQFFGLLSLLMLSGAFSLFAQMPAAIDIQPANASVYDEITLTLTLDEACFEAGSLLGSPYVAIHSGITINGNPWQKVINFDGTGANGQSPILNYVSEGVYAITYIPTEFYGILPNEVVTQICGVFNNGNNWDQDARDFQSGSTDCADFFIPINPGSPPGDPFLHSIVPAQAEIGETISVQIFGLNTNFQASPTTTWFEKDSETIPFIALQAVNDTLLSATFDILYSASIGTWDVVTDNAIDGELILANGFEILDTVSVFPASITMVPSDATAYDEITLTLNTGLSCPAGSLVDTDSVMMHSGVSIGGAGWQYVVDFNATGANGLAPMLSSNGDNTWSLTFTPFDFYGFPAGSMVEAITCVFNGGSWTSGEAKDFDLDENCIDYIIPLNLSTDVSEVKISSFNVYPNPVSQTLHINSEAAISQFKIYSVDGRIIISGDGSGHNSVSINVSLLEEGLYILEFENGDKTLKRKKFFKN